MSINNQGINCPFSILFKYSGLILWSGGNLETSAWERGKEFQSNCTANLLGLLQQIKTCATSNFQSVSKNGKRSNLSHTEVVYSNCIQKQFIAMKKNILPIPPLLLPFQITAVEASI